VVNFFQGLSRKCGHPGNSSTGTQSTVRDQRVTGCCTELGCASVGVRDEEPATEADDAEAADLDLNSTAAGDAGLYAAEAGDTGCDGRSKHTRLGRRTVSALLTSPTSSLP